MCRKGVIALAKFLSKKVNCPLSIVVMHETPLTEVTFKQSSFLLVNASHLRNKFEPIWGNVLPSLETSDHADST